MKHKSAGRAGVHLVGLRIENDLGWMFRDQPVNDYRIDAQVELTDEDGEVTGQLVALQIKAGQSYLRRTGEKFVYYGENKHLDYWLSYALPVVLMLCDLENEEIYWQVITPLSDPVR